MTPSSWGRYPKPGPQEIRTLRYPFDDLPAPDGRSLLPYGQGRSYGDSCLNDNGVLLATRELDRFISFDAEQGLLACEAGVTLEQILQWAVPRGWFLPTTPGTKFVSVGGAIANDVHGKNHHRAGTFGNALRRFGLSRSDGSRRVCSPQSDPELFQATIGGLGLTGLITWAEFRLQRITSAIIEMETLPLRNLSDYFAAAAESDRGFEHTVAWVDCLATGEALGRGVLMRGNFAKDPSAGALQTGHAARLSVPIDVPGFLLNGITMKLFNTAYYAWQSSGPARRRVHYEPFFYPLDSVLHWNRLYGSRGFMQYQCVVPHEQHEGLRDILRRISKARKGSFLAVLKTFGSMKSPGLMSFAREGVTLALDFPNEGPRTLKLLEELDHIVRQCGGAVYPAKDARMSPESFRAYFPRWARFSAYVDPEFSSNLWRRVTAS